MHCKSVLLLTLLLPHPMQAGGMSILEQAKRSVSDNV